MAKVLVIGGGFAGLYATRKLLKSGLDLEITLCDKKTTSDFLPLLPDLIGRGFNPGLLTYKIEDLTKNNGLRLFNAEVLGLDLSRKEAYTAKNALSYDCLLIASGSETNFYGNTSLIEYSFKLDDVEDARQILKALEAKSYENYLVAGGGYTGIELATNLRRYLEKNKKGGRILIIERSTSILGPLPQWVKEYALNSLEKMDIEVIVNSSVEHVDPDNARISSGKAFSKYLLIWAAGVKCADFIQKLPVEKNPQGRIKVDEFLRLNPECFVAGDAAYVVRDKHSLRMAVQFAITEGETCAENIIRSIKKMRLRKYRPVDLGYIIPLANNKSCGNVFGLRVKERIATLLHFTMCLYRLRGKKNKMGLWRELKGGASMVDYASLVLRIGLGIMFMAHGLQFTFGLFGGPGAANFSHMLVGLGFPLPLLWSYLAAYSTLICGFFLIIGFFTRLACVPLAIFILVAAVSVHLKKGFFLMHGGYEYNFVILVGLAALMLLGPGKHKLR